MVAAAPARPELKLVAAHRNAKYELPTIEACRYPLMVALLAGVVGVQLSRWVPHTTTEWIGWACGMMAAWYGVRRVVKHRVTATWCGQLFLLGAVGALFAGRFEQSRQRFLPDDLGQYVRQESVPVRLQGRVMTQPKCVYAQLQQRAGSFYDRRGDQTRLEVQVESILLGGTWTRVSGRTRGVVEGHLLGVRAGDRVHVVGTLRRPSEALNPGQFSHAEYERSRGYSTRLLVDHPQAVSVVQRAADWDPRWWLSRLRGTLHEVLWDHLRPEGYGLAAAILLGSRENLGEQRVDGYFLTGTIHLLAISGLHVGLLAAGFLYAARLQWMSKRWSLYAVIGVTVIYALIAESRAPVLRATVLVVVLCLGELRREVAISWNTLCAAALVVLLINPVEMLETGALLSFLAVGGLITFVPQGLGRYPEDPLDRLLLKSRPAWQRSLRGIFWRVARLGLASLAVWCVVLPMVVHQFHIVTPIGLLLNMFIFVPIGVALFSGMGVLVLSWPIPWLAVVMARICDESLRLLDVIIATSQSWPYGHSWWAGPPVSVVWCFYLALACCIPIRSMRRKWSMLGVLMICYTVTSCFGWPPRQAAAESASLRCTFLSVGHGLAIVIQTPDDQTWLYDAGSLGDPRYTCDTIARYLWSRGIHRIDRLIVSHADADHYNAVPGLLRRFDVARIAVTPQMRQSASLGLGPFWEQIASQAIPIEELALGDVLSHDGGFQAEVLHPPREVDYSSDNANSLVLRIAYQGRSLLLTGDLERDGLARFEQESRVNCDVVLAPHHGSLHSHPLEFAEHCEAQWIVVSGENALESGLVDRSTGAVLLDTARCGAVFVRMDDRGIHVDTFRSADGVSK